MIADTLREDVTITPMFTVFSSWNSFYFKISLSLSKRYLCVTVIIATAIKSKTLTFIRLWFPLMSTSKGGDALWCDRYIFSWPGTQSNPTRKRYLRRVFHFKDLCLKNRNRNFVKLWNAVQGSVQQIEIEFSLNDFCKIYWKVTVDGDGF